MDSADIAVIVQKARELRAAELRKLSGMLAARARIHIHLLSATVGALLHALSETLRPLFSWHPEHRHP